MVEYSAKAFLHTIHICVLTVSLFHHVCGIMYTMSEIILFIISISLLL